ncbi:serine/threonine-protein kinase [Streptomyces sp. RKAG337]|uniref:serine/threonine-protein kinase n=1 Tax=Streptomyces sp. RKAG337 TaxID=2893404 RepID=UPI0020339156|nr:serine/threonine-protein kinase [Streptomyces sp. RKAG337]MCM2426857.1 serine/threonine protein kinase [Streptomyces sp. RKAG337]
MDRTPGRRGQGATENPEGDKGSVAVPQQTSAEGYRLPPGYKLLRQAGTGRHSSVLLCAEEATGAEVAVKLLAVTVDDESTRLAAHSELLSAGAAARHPCSVTVEDAGFTADHRPYLVEQFCRGGNAQAKLANSGPFPVDETIVIGTRLALALHSAHRRGVLHLDVRPANILFDENGDALLADHGLARVLQRSAPQLGAVFDPMFVPRELFGWEKPGPAADVYSLGATLYALLNGEPAYADAGRTSWSALYAEVLRGELPYPAHRHDIPDPLLILVRRMMSANPEGRPPLTEVHRSLRSLLSPSAATKVPALEPEPAMESPLPGWDPADDLTPEEQAAVEQAGARAQDEAKRQSRKRLIAATTALVVFAAAATTATLVLRDRSSKPQPKASSSASTAPGPTSSAAPVQVPADKLPGLMPQNVQAVKANGNVQITWKPPTQAAQVAGYVVRAVVPGGGEPLQKTPNGNEPAVVFTAGSVTADTCYTVNAVISVDGKFQFAPSKELCKTAG